MKTINISSEHHIFEKQNLVTITSKRGCYDILKCSKCGMTGKTNSLSTMSIRNEYNDHKIKFCNLTKKEALAFERAKSGKKVKITICRAIGEAFENLTPNSIHKVIDAPSGYENMNDGVWVMGVSEPVKILNEEFKNLTT